MSLLDLLSSKDVWLGFLEHKSSGEFFFDDEKEDLEAFIKKEKYLPVCQRIKSKEDFPLARIHRINKKNSEKKRTVFVFPRAENYVLKLLAFLLYKYDYLFEKNLYSFRQKIGVKQAVVSTISQIKGKGKYTYKADIHDYFNSVSTEKIVSILKERITDDGELVEFIEGILKEPYAMENGTPVAVKKGIMAGVPISGFLADLYLCDLDRYFSERGILYARYSDDIIVFADSEEEIASYERTIKEHLAKMDLEINPKKEYHTVPGEAWEFLGFTVNGREVDVAESSVKKMKDKIRRKSRSLVRWWKRSGKKPKYAVRALIKKFNSKLYNNTSPHELTWCKWYFPTINTDKSLREIDHYMIDCARYIMTGKHTKANYNLRYEDLKKLGFRSLVNEFYRFKSTPEE